MKMFGLAGATILFNIIGIGLWVAQIYFFFWLAGWFYDLGWWPIGAILRIAAWIEIVGVVLVTIFIVIGWIMTLLKREEA